MENKGYTIVSMYTRDTLYEDIIKKLKESLDRFDLPYKLYSISSSGDWSKNAQQKANIILTALAEFRTPIVWVDADAVIMKDPVFFENLNCDISYYRYNYYRDEILSGTLYFGNTPVVNQLILDWIKVNNTNKNWDQINLQGLILGKYKDMLKTTPLPVDYIKIFDNKYQKSEDPVIVHYQASRKARVKINRGIR